MVGFEEGGVRPDQTDGDAPGKAGKESPVLAGPGVVLGIKSSTGGHNDTKDPQSGVVGH